MMNAEINTSRILQANAQLYQRLWDSWVEIMHGWNEALGASIGVWQEAFGKVLEAHSDLLQQTAAQEGAKKEGGEKKVA